MTLEQSKCKLFYFQEKHAKEIFFILFLFVFSLNKGKIMLLADSFLTGIRVGFLTCPSHI